MLCEKQSAIILIINNKQTNLLLKNLLRLHSGPSLEKSTPAPLLFSKIIKTPAGVYSDTPAPVHLWCLVVFVWPHVKLGWRMAGISRAWPLFYC